MNGAGRQALCALAVAATLTSCDGIQSMTGGDGFHGQQFIGLFALFMGVTGLFYVAVALFLAVSLLRVYRAPQDRRTDPGRPGPGRAERGLMRALLGWTGLILVGLSVLTIGSYLADRNSARAAAAPAKLKITITAHQWWWEVEYQDPSPFNIFRTANELHLPRGIPVDITLRSDDVIHSFWAPNLAGKQDLIPGRSGEIRSIASHDGLYRAECAEFCGVQHAHMALDVTVQSPVEFTAWTDSRRAPAAAPESSLAAAGQDYFMKRECAACHSISGTSARGSIGPDLTHFAGRRSIAAGTYPMTRGHLYGWVADPQSAKPGNRMPVLALNAAELHALVAYLETLR